MRMRSSGTSSSSAAICASAVRMPCPSSTFPVTIVTVPSRSKRTRRMARDFSASTQNRLDDAVVRAASTEVFIESCADFRFAWVLVLFKQGSGADGNAAHAEAALRRLLLDERLLHRMQFAVAAQAFHRGYFLAGDGPERHIA